MKPPATLVAQTQAERIFVIHLKKPVINYTAVLNAKFLLVNF